MELPLFEAQLANNRLMLRDMVLPSLHAIREDFNLLMVDSMLERQGYFNAETTARIAERTGYNAEDIAAFEQCADLGVVPHDIVAYYHALYVQLTGALRPRWPNTRRGDR